MILHRTAIAILRNQKETKAAFHTKIIIGEIMFVKTTLRQEIKIDKIITIHYFEYDKNYKFAGESHGFWELLYVDKGEVDAVAGEEVRKLKQGQMIFHKPGEFHNVMANGVTAPNLVIISFECGNSAMDFFNDKILFAGDFEKNCLSNIMNEAKSAFENPLDDPYTIKMQRREERGNFACEQLIKINLELMLINFIRVKDKIPEKLSTVTRENYDSELTAAVIGYMQRNLYNKIKFSDICLFMHTSATNLKSTFKQKTGQGIMEYYRVLKIAEAKKLMREENMNFTQISERLCYSSVHYFSRHFKEITSLTPTEYALSIKAKSSKAEFEKF